MSNCKTKCEWECVSTHTHTYASVYASIVKCTERYLRSQELCPTMSYIGTARKGSAFDFETSVGPRHRAWETTWVATIALSRATRFWWRDTHCTTAVWRWLITVADRTHTRVPRSNTSTYVHRCARKSERSWQRIAPRRHRRPDLDFRWRKTAGGPVPLGGPGSDWSRNKSAATKWALERRTWD